MSVAAAFVALGAAGVDAQDLGKPGTVFRDCPDCPEMVVIPAGEFEMGNAQSERPEEKPVVKVRIAKPFALSKTEVSFDDWEICVQANRCPSPDDHKWGRGAQPVIKISWQEAVNYAIFLSEKTGKRYRLPSEAEWEYAARGGTKTPFWWGSEPGTRMANCRNCGTEFHHRASPVATFAANPFGLHDMNGNLAEWTLDCWVENHQGAKTDGSPRDAAGCDKRTIRSGSWYYIAKIMSSAYRTSFLAAHSSYQIGIRLLRELP